MIHGRRPPQVDGLGSWFTKLRDAINPVKLVQKTAAEISRVADKLNITPIERFADEVARSAGKVYDEGTRAGENPIVIKTASAIGAAVLTYFGQVTLAASLMEAASKYAEGVQAKKDIRTTAYEAQRDTEVADSINSLIPFMSASDQQYVKSIYDQVGYKAYDNAQVKMIVAKAQEIYDSQWSISLKKHVSRITLNNDLTPTLLVYINQIINTAISIPIKNPQLKSDTIEAALVDIAAKLNALPSSTVSYLSHAFASQGADALKQKDVSDVIMSIVRSAMVIIARGVAIGGGQSPDQATQTAQAVVGNMTPIGFDYEKYLPYIGVAGVALIASML